MNKNFCFKSSYDFNDLVSIMSILRGEGGCPWDREQDHKTIRNNFIEEVYVWLTITEDVKNDLIRVSIRSRGPEINQVAEKYHGGGHKFASGAKFKSFDEAMKLVDDLDLTVKKYRETQEVA